MWLCQNSINQSQATSDIKMATYIGYPVSSTLSKAFRILRLEYNMPEYILSSQDKISLINKANKYCQDHSTNLGIHYSDTEDQYIIGYKTYIVKEWKDNTCSIHKAVEIIENLKKQFAQDLIKLNADLSQVTFYDIEWESMKNRTQVLAFMNRFPEPFVMNYV